LNNTKHMIGKGIILLLFILLACYEINALEILQENSTGYITEMNYSLNVSGLNLNALSVLIAEENLTVNSTLMTVQTFINTSYNASYDCYLDISSQEYIYRYIRNSEILDFDNDLVIHQYFHDNATLFDGQHYARVNCTYNLTQANMTFQIITNSTLPNCVQNISCLNDSLADPEIQNTAETKVLDVLYNSFTIFESGEKYISIDTLLPSINLGFIIPSEGFNYSIINISGNHSPDYTQDYVLSYLYLGQNDTADNVTSKGNLTLNISVFDLNYAHCIMHLLSGDLMHEASYPLSVNDSVNASQFIITLPLDEGNHYISFDCSDTYSWNATLYINLTYQRVAAPVVVPFFNLMMSKDTFNIGESGYYSIAANNNSNISLTICPVASGWVQCQIQQAYMNGFELLQQIMSYTNKSGRYMIDGISKYNNSTIKTNTSFVVVNSVSSQINPSRNKAPINSLITFTTEASGGIAPYTYKWVMHDNSVFWGPSAYKNYTSSGSFNISLFVNDSQNNQFNSSMSVTIKDIFSLRIILVDNRTNQRIPDVRVSIGDDEAYSGSNGEVSYSLVQGSYDIYAIKDDYNGVFIDSFNLNSSKTLYFNMSFIDEYPPNISLLTKDGIKFSEGDVKLKFKAHDISKLYCELYVADVSDSWFEKTDYGDNLLVDTEYTFEIPDLGIGSYKWRIDCTDSDGNFASSSEYSFSVSGGSDQLTVSDEEIDSTDSDMASVLDYIESLSGPESEVAEAFAIKESLRSVMEKSSNLNRDIHNLVYRRDLDEAGREDAQDELIRAIDELKLSIPVNINVRDSKTFVKYVRDDVLFEILGKYISANNIVTNDQAFFESTKKSQSKAIISTKVYDVSFTYNNGKSEDKILIIKDISLLDSTDEMLFDNSNTITFLEYVPKVLAPSYNAITILTPNSKLVVDGTILEFSPKVRRIAYYFNKSFDIGLAQDADTIIVDRSVDVSTSSTGFAIIGLGSISDISFDGKFIMILLVSVLLVVYLIMTFDIHSKIIDIFSGTKKKVAYITLLVNDSLDYLAAEDYEKASLIYREIQLSYESSNDAVRTKVFQDCYDLCNKLDIYFFNSILARTHTGIREQNITQAMLNYSVLKQTYEKIDPAYRGALANDFNDVTGRVIALG